MMPANMSTNLVNFEAQIQDIDMEINKYDSHSPCITNPATLVQTISPHRSRPKWEPPPPSHLKINFDGVVFRETEEAGLGVVICDSQGKVPASLVEKIKLPSSLDKVEELAAVRAITLAMDLNLPSFIVEEDSEDNLIHASIRKSFVNHLRDIQEGKIYRIKYFGVVENKDAYRTVNHKCNKGNRRNFFHGKDRGAWEKIEQKANQTLRNKMLK
ncbi:hypothetical protein SO802_004628 [Lithocarpus litseifolius]|uniref:RNase H type-1 domain-containing protein n=1 Tax=Lithocarpus litseifolius TaxID=425828 RepID=A0AAW2E7I8_9ROSI